VKTVQGDWDSEPYDDEVDIWWTTTFDVLQCCGCREVMLRRIYTFSEYDESNVRYFPPRVSRHSPNWAQSLPEELKLLLDEIYRALDADNHRLPLMGARALLDMVMVDKVGDVGGFGQKLKELEKAGYVSSKNREILESALDAGHAAAHRGHATPTTVNIVMDIVENMLQVVYVLHDAAAKLKKSTPPRPARQLP
jgi:hypothetical protein